MEEKSSTPSVQTQARINQMGNRQNFETQKSSNSLQKGTFRIYSSFSLHFSFLKIVKKKLWFSPARLSFSLFIVHHIPYIKFCSGTENREGTLLKINLSMISTRTFSPGIVQM